MVQRSKNRFRASDGVGVRAVGIVDHPGLHQSEVEIPVTPFFIGLCVHSDRGILRDRFKIDALHLPSFKPGIDLHILRFLCGASLHGDVLDLGPIQINPAILGDQHAP